MESAQLSSAAGVIHILPAVGACAPSQSASGIGMQQRQSLATSRRGRLAAGCDVPALPRARRGAPTSHGFLGLFE